MACNLTKGYSVDCKDSIGGLKAVYFFKEYCSNIRDAATFDGTDVLTMDAGGFSNWLDSAGAAISSPTVFRYLLRPGASNLNTTVNSSSENGTTFFTQTLSLTLPKLSTGQTNEIKLISQGRSQVFVEDNNGNMFLIGMDNGCETTGGTIVTGAAKGDLTGFTLEVAGEELDPMIWLNASTGGVTPTALKAPFNGLTDVADLTVTAG